MDRVFEQASSTEDGSQHVVALAGRKLRTASRRPTVYGAQAAIEPARIGTIGLSTRPLGYDRGHV